MFSEDIETAVNKLNDLFRHSNRKRLVIAKYPIIEINIFERSRTVTFNLFYIHDQYLEIQVPTYRFLPKVSHYDFKAKEKRWIRDKAILFSFIKDLKYSGLWDFVINKDFLVVNENNEYFDKEKAEKILRRKIDSNE